MPKKVLKSLLGKKRVASNSEAETEEDSEAANLIQQWNSDKLTLSYRPRDFDGRFQEKQIITKFIKDALVNRMSCKVLYISGVPGVGKTATTAFIVDSMAQGVKRAKFNFFNALSFRKPSAVYYSLLEKLLDQPRGERPANRSINSTIQVIAKVLETIKVRHLVVIDQVDFLLTKDQSILYNLFEWASSPKLSLIIIANTVDFPERLMPKVVSRMGNHRLVFKPYSQKEITALIAQRLAGCRLFEASAISFACKKMAAFSSDLRRLLTVLHATALQAEEKGAKVSVNEISAMWRTIMEDSFYEEAEHLFPEAYRAVFEAIHCKQNSFSVGSEVSVSLHQKGLNGKEAQLLLQDMVDQGLISTRECTKKGFLQSQLKVMWKT